MMIQCMLALVIWGAANVMLAAEQCTEFRKRQIAVGEIGLATRGAIITSAKLVKSHGGGFCKILGQVRSVDPAADPIRFEVNLPESWNRKAVQFGGGVFDGYLRQSDGLWATVVADKRQAAPLERGYATFGSDSGHHHRYLFLPDFLNALGARFGLNDEERKNFASDGLKKTHDVAMVLMRARYGTGPARMYFIGGSTGGREAMKVVNRWPEDYDGVLAAYAAWNQIESDLQFIRVSQAMYGKGDGQSGWLPGAKTKLLFQASMSACDAQDGLKDGMISNPDGCRFDPANLRCGDGKDHKGCLSDRQEQTVPAFAADQISNFAVMNGIRREPGYNVLKGADLTGSMGLLSHAFHPPIPLLNSLYYIVGDGVLRFFLTKDVHFDALTFDTKAGGKWLPALLQQSAEDDASLADLSPFERRGGKLLLVHGTTDSTIPTGASVFLYQRIVEAMGQTRTDGFARLYLIPGYGHGHGVFDAGFDTVGTLDAWADKNIAPAGLVVTDGNKGAARTRPMCAWPAWPKYVGGDVNAAASFQCVE